MTPKFPVSPYEKTSGILYFARMLHKARLNARNELDSSCLANLGQGFDSRCCNFLGVQYHDVVARVAGGLTNREILEWCFETGRRPDDEQIEVWNEFMRKRGWNDPSSARLALRKMEAGLESRSDIETFFDLIDAEEGRLAPALEAPMRTGSVPIVQRP